MSASIGQSQIKIGRELSNESLKNVRPRSSGLSFCCVCALEISDRSVRLNSIMLHPGPLINVPHPCTHTQLNAAIISIPSPVHPGRGSQDNAYNLKFFFTIQRLMQYITIRESIEFIDSYDVPYND
jgi:hypothetical protein